jgi:hypothetical protein
MTEATFAFDLHVLGTPPALILSQDQTLMLKAFAAAPACAGASAELVNARPIGSALFSPFSSWFAASRRSRTEDPVGRFRGATR